MAGKVVDVTFRLIDKVTSPLGGINKNLKSSANQWTKAGREIQKSGKTISSVGSSLTKSLTVPITALGTASVVSFGEVDKSLQLVKQTMGEAKWATADLESSIKQASASSVFTMQEATDATLNFARQGFNAKESAEMLSPALDLASGTATDLSEVTSGLGNTLKVFSEQGLDAETAVNVFAKAQAQANTTTSDLFEAMSVGSSVFKSVGWTMQDLATVTDVFGDNFITGSEGATAMKTGLARLLSPAKDGAEWIKKLNLELVDQNGNMKSMTDVQSQLHKAFSGLTEEEQIQASSAIFGKNQMSKWLALIKTAPETVEGYRSSLDGLEGTASGMSDALMSGVGGSIEKLKSTFDVFKYSVGESVGSTAKSVIDGVTGILDRFNNMDEGTRNMIVKIGAVVASIGPAIMLFGKGVTVVGRITTAVGKFGKMLKTFGSLAGIITSPAGIVIMVLGAIVIATILVIKHWDKVKEIAKKVFGYIKNIFSDLGISTDSIKEKLSPITQKILFIGEVAKEMWKIVSPILLKIGQVLFTVFGTTLGAVIGGAIGCFRSLIDSVIEIANSIMNIFGGIITFLTGLFTGNWKMAWEGIVGIFGGIFDTIVALAKTPINAVISLINGAISGINNLGLTIPDWVPVIGGKAFSIDIPKIPTLARGTDDWKGGIVQISERGGEIVDLPTGSRVYPHDETVKKAYKDGAKSGKTNITIAKLADQIIVREEADIDRIAEQIANRLEKTVNNVGGDDLEYGYVY